MIDPSWHASKIDRLLDQLHLWHLLFLLCRFGVLSARGKSGHNSNLSQTNFTLAICLFTLSEFVSLYTFSNKRTRGS